MNPILFSSALGSQFHRGKTSAFCVKPAFNRIITFGQEDLNLPHGDVLNIAVAQEAMGDDLKLRDLDEIAYAIKQARRGEIRTPGTWGCHPVVKVTYDFNGRRHDVPVGPNGDSWDHEQYVWENRQGMPYQKAIEAYVANYRRTPPDYSNDRSKYSSEYLIEIQRRIAKLRLQSRYIAQLRRLTGGSAFNAMVTATAKQRCQAALLAVRDKSQRKRKETIQ
jgi:hypothetical protein